MTQKGRALSSTFSDILLAQSAASKADAYPTLGCAESVNGQVVAANTAPFQWVMDFSNAVKYPMPMMISLTTCRPAASGTLDSVLYLWSSKSHPTGTQKAASVSGSLASNDDDKQCTGNTIASTINYKLTSNDIYYVTLNGYWSSSTMQKLGSFTLSLFCQPTSITCDSSVQFTISAALNRVTIPITGTMPANPVVTATTCDTVTNFDTFMSVLNTGASAALVANDDDAKCASGKTKSTVTYGAANGQDLSIAVNGYSATTYGTFRLTVNCESAAWSAWSDLSATCGTGYRTRTCSGVGCAGVSQVVVEGAPCPPVDGQYGSWSVCSASCETGTQARICNNPAPAYGGAPCVGPSKQNCNTQACSVCATERVRKEWRELTTAEQTRYHDAVNKLKAAGTYDVFVATHANNADFSHGTSAFLPWHRQYVLDYENALRALGGEFACMTVPFWDWSLDSGKEKSSVIFSSTTGFGSAGGSTSSCITTGPFAGWKNNQVSPPTCVARGSSIAGSFASINTMQSMVASSSEYSVWRPAFEGTPHASVHNIIGSSMGTMASPNDPLFFMHHTNIDRLWAVWQDCWNYDEVPNSAITPNIYQAVSPCKTGRCGELDAVMDGLKSTPRQMHNIVQLGYRYQPSTWDSASTVNFCKWNWFVRDPEVATAAAVFLEEKTEISLLELHNQETSFAVPRLGRGRRIARLTQDQKDMIAEGNHLYWKKLQETGDPREALRSLAQRECALHPAPDTTSAAFSMWWHMNGFADDECKKGFCNNYCDLTVSGDLQETNEKEAEKWDTLAEAHNYRKNRRDIVAETAEIASKEFGIDYLPATTDAPTASA